jgi:hypothetical protein
MAWRIFAYGMESLPFFSTELESRDSGIRDSTSPRKSIEKVNQLTSFVIAPPRMARIRAAVRAQLAVTA